MRLRFDWSSVWVVSLTSEYIAGGVAVSRNIAMPMCPWDTRLRTGFHAFHIPRSPAFTLLSWPAAINTYLLSVAFDRGVNFMLCNYCVIMSVIYRANVLIIYECPNYRTRRYKNLEVYDASLFESCVFQSALGLTYNVHLFSNNLSNAVELFIVTEYFSVSCNLILRTMLIGNEGV